MNMDGKIVDALKKVTLSVTHGNAPDGSETTVPTRRLTFIFGVGSQGLTPFEYQLARRRPGEVVNIAVTPEEVGDIFGHLQPLFCGLWKEQGRVYLNIAIDDVEEAGHREVVQAMAGSAACGADCSCGCGGH